MVGWKKHKLESRLPGEISITSAADDTTLLGESEEELKSLLMKVKECRDPAPVDPGIRSGDGVGKDRETTA